MTVSVPRSPATDEMQELAELKQARDQYEAAFEAAFDAQVIINDDARIIEANPEAATIYGLDRSDLRGRAIPEFLPDDFDFEAAWTEFQNSGRDRDTVTIKGADGVDRQVEYTASTDIVPGQHLVISRDITDRLQREEQLARAETVFQHTQDAIFLIHVSDNGEFHVDRVNQVYEELTGISNEEIQGKTPREVVGDEIGREIEAQYRKCVQRRETIEYPEEIPIDGEMRYWQTKLTPVIDDGKVKKLVGAMRDVTDQKDR
jgi:PAS domain S-box-containing protein